ncbi:MAG TPA: ABC transporter permease [Propionibacteriaceae bacterium]
MTAIDFRPAPAAAPAWRRVLAHGLTEIMLLVRNGEQLLLALVVPIGILLGGRLFGGRFGDTSTLAPSVMALAIWSSAFTSVAIATGFERRYGVLERLAPTPLGKLGLLAGKALSLLVVVVGQLVVVVAVGLLAGWRPQLTPGSVLVMLTVTLLGVATFGCLGLALAGRLRAESTLALANLIYVVLLAGGALVLPVSRYPELVQGVIRLLPTAALGEGLRAGAVGQVLIWPVLVLLGWLAVAVTTAWRGFRWMS